MSLRHLKGIMIFNNKMENSVHMNLIMHLFPSPYGDYDF